MSRVWDESPRKGSALLLLLAIADFANEHGEAWPSVDTLANKCRMSRRNVQTLASELAKDGDITIDENAGPRGCNIYRLSKIAGDEKFARAKNSARKTAEGDANQRIQSAHNPSGPASEPGGTPSAGAVEDSDLKKSEHQKLIDDWHECFEAAFGTRYVILGGADGKAAKQLLSATKLSSSEIIKVATAAWSKSDRQAHWTCVEKSRTIRELAANWNRILAELDRPAPGQIAAGKVIDRVGKQAPEGLIPESQRPTPGYDEQQNKIPMDEYERRFPIENYYDEATLQPLG